jgi:hypothetical protein
LLPTKDLLRQRADGDIDDLVESRMITGRLAEIAQQRAKLATVLVNSFERVDREGCWRDVLECAADAI